jgi:hypothetical protein
LRFATGLMNPPSVVTLRMSAAAAPDGATAGPLDAPADGEPDGDPPAELGAALGPDDGPTPEGAAPDPQAMTRSAVAARAALALVRRMVIGAPNTTDRRRAPRLAAQTSSERDRFHRHR